jgi:hypothetical protein
MVALCETKVEEGTPFCVCVRVCVHMCVYVSLYEEIH